jgi:FKBP-type peptidyl-prolyl cis-trans isomerase
MAYEGKLMSNGSMFDSGNGYSFRLGDGKVLPGWEQGLSVRVLFYM